MPKSDYVIVKADNTICPLCEKKVLLLQDERIRKRMPMFWICFNCEFVAQVGKGIVHRIGQREDKEVK